MLRPLVARSSSGRAILMAHRQREIGTDVSALDSAADRAVTIDAAVRQDHCLHRRRRAKCVPLLLCITDHDTGRFTLEGPMTPAEAEAWIKEIIVARRAGRDITCRVFPGLADEAAMTWGGEDGGAHWPSGSIVSPELLDRG